MTNLLPTRRRQALAAGVAGLSLLLTGCSQSAGASQDIACERQMTSQQKADLQAYLNQHPEISNDTTNTPQTVCVIEGDEVHNYNSGDNWFKDYYLYSILSRQSGALATFALLDNQDRNMSTSQLLALDLLTQVDNRGRVYQPYTRQPNGDYQRGRTELSDIQITHVQYGDKPAASYSTAQKTTPPAGYTKPATIPPAAKASAAKVEVGGKVTPTPAKKANGNNYQNPAANNADKGANAGNSDPNKTKSGDNSQTKGKGGGKGGGGKSGGKGGGGKGGGVRVGGKR